MAVNLRPGDKVTATKRINLMTQSDIVEGENGIIYWADNRRGIAAVQFEQRLMVWNIRLDSLKICY